MNSLSESRRNFLRNMLAAGIATAACPHFLLGRTDPEIIIADQTVTIMHKINVKDYPALANDFGSVRVDVLDPAGKNFRVVVTRVPYSRYKKYFAVVGEICPHQGQVIGDPQPPAGLMRCNLGHGSIFTPDGTFVSGPAAGKNLNKYRSFYDTDTGILDIELIFVIAGTDVADEDSNLSFLGEVYPNPAGSSVLVNYGLEKGGYLRLALYDNSGREVAVLADGYCEPGIKSLSYNVSSLDSGVYFLNMSAGQSAKFVKKLVVQK
jgi:Rieske Fe-S protein